jgi:hypothetical protein
MKTILGKVTSLDVATKTFTVTSVTGRAGGRTRTKKFEVSWSGDSSFLTKGRRKLRSSPGRIRIGMNVIVQLPRLDRPIDTVWLPPGDGTIYLTVRECRDLGGEVVSDGSCPELGAQPDVNSVRKRCKITGHGSSCITVLA